MPKTINTSPVGGDRVAGAGADTVAPVNRVQVLGRREAL
jgi:hypothetical protein